MLSNFLTISICSSNFLAQNLEHFFAFVTSLLHNASVFLGVFMEVSNVKP